MVLFCILEVVWAELKAGASRPLHPDLIWSGERQWVEVVVKNKTRKLSTDSQTHCVIVRTIVSNSTESVCVECDKKKYVDFHAPLRRRNSSIRIFNFLFGFSKTQ